MRAQGDRFTSQSKFFNSNSLFKFPIVKAPKNFTSLEPELILELILLARAYTKSREFLLIYCLSNYTICNYIVKVTKKVFFGFFGLNFWFFLGFFRKKRGARSRSPSIYKSELVRNFQIPLPYSDSLKYAPIVRYFCKMRTFLSRELPRPGLPARGAAPAAPPAVRPTGAGLGLGRVHGRGFLCRGLRRLSLLLAPAGAGLARPDTNPNQAKDLLGDGALGLNARSTAPAAPGATFPA